MPATAPANGSQRPAANQHRGSSHRSHCGSKRERDAEDEIEEGEVVEKMDIDGASSQQNSSSRTSIPAHNWQASKATLKERFSFLFNNEILADVHFVIGDPPSAPVPAHKFVLSCGSAVFDALFNGPLATEETVIRLPDVELPAFRALLRFLYSDEVCISPDTVMTVLYTAKKYAVPALESSCVDFLKSALCADNAFMLLTQARLFDEPQLANLCLENIDKNTCEALSADGFLDIDLETLGAVLERDTLRIREANLFDYCVRWAEHRCEKQGLAVIPANKRMMLGRALYLIRFPLMTVEEFAQGPAQTEVLTDREVVDLFLYFTLNPKPDVQFVDVARCCMTGKGIVCSRFQNVESRWGYSGTSDRVRFVVDRRIFLVGFGLYGSIHMPQEYEVNIALLHTSTNKSLASNDVLFDSDGTKGTFHVMFRDPVEILPGTSYTACATLRGADSHYGTRGKSKVIVETHSGEKVTFKFSYAAGNNNGTSVEDGQIPELIFYL
ncbi:unnamed protein product [Cyprideis torosa]|uniref:Uncharacterized protein n=1 Tax=Cyprideis torosa TaxID=163714 RepID=A0A7R8WAJ2_9CRUS|nr:unnamed protein product [Cyprideis torosa]CAG0886407.1 unnamed protein product [Cyprideis torosa]